MLSADEAAVIDVAITDAVRELSIYNSDAATHEIAPQGVIAMYVFAFTAKITRSVDEAEKAEAEFHKRAAVLADPVTTTPH